MEATTVAPRRRSAGSSRSRQASTPGPESPTAFTSVGPNGADARRRIALPREGGERLHHDRSEFAKIAVARELVTEARRTRRGKHA